MGGEVSERVYMSTELENVRLGRARGGFVVVLQEPAVVPARAANHVGNVLFQTSKAQKAVGNACGVGVAAKRVRQREEEGAGERGRAEEEREEEEGRENRI